MPKQQRLILNLIGRICIVTQGNKRFAVFLNAKPSQKFHIRSEHKPILRAPLRRVKQQADADRAKLAIGTIASHKTGPLADAEGIWELSGYAMEFIKGIDSSGPPQNVPDQLADLNAIVGDHAHVHPGILGPHPPKSVLARLSLPIAAKITPFVEHEAPRTFIPGTHQQQLADFVSCVIPFQNSLRGPTLQFKSFDGKQQFNFEFNAGLAGGFEALTLTMSNLCKCVEQEDVEDEKTHRTIDDQEFAVYYKLFKIPSRAPLPVPSVGAGTANFGGFGVPECYRMARVTVPPGR